MKYMVSVGYQHDMHIHVWNWRVREARFSGHQVCFSLHSLQQSDFQLCSCFPSFFSPLPPLQAGRSVATNKITSKVYGLAFSEDGKYFVTAGNRRVRFWNMHFSSTGKDEKVHYHSLIHILFQFSILLPPVQQTTPLKGRSAILGNLQDNCFMAVECGRGSIAPFTYVLTRSGILCKFDQNRALDMFVTVQVYMSTV